jgi:hypothetical protein
MKELLRKAEPDAGSPGDDPYREKYALPLADFCERPRADYACIRMLRRCLMEWR